MITLSVQQAKGIFAKSIGLMGAKTPTSLFFKTRFGIHTFFLAFPIDVVIMDKDYRVVVLFQNVLPQRVILWSPVYDNVLELPAGTIKKEKIHKGSSIALLFRYSLLK